MTKYTTLPTLTTIQGTFSFTLWSDIVDLTIPTIQTIKTIGEVVEIADRSVGISELSTLEITVRDDASSYDPEGFWFMVLAQDMKLRIYLNEGAGNTFYFFGTVQPETVKWDEHYISATQRIRTATFSMINDAGQRIFDCPTTTWITEILANDLDLNVESDGDPHDVITVTGLFAAMLSASAVNPNYSTADIVYRLGSAADLKYKIGAGIYGLNELYIATQYGDGAGGGALIDYFNTAMTTCLASYVDGGFYDKLRDLLAMLLTNFGLVMRFDYNIGTERVLMEVCQRGRADADAGFLDFNSREKGSIIGKSTDLVGDAIRVTDLLQSTQYVWMSKKYADFTTFVAPPTYVDFDIDVKCAFIVDPDAATSTNHALYAWSGELGVPPVPIDGLSWFDYSATPQAYVDTALADEWKMMEAIAGYRYKRFTHEYSSIIRTYGGMYADTGAGDTHMVLEIMRRTQIDDGASTKNYFANRVTKKIKEDEVEIEWIQE